MNICVAMQYFKKLTQHWFRALQVNKGKKQSEAKICVKVLHSFGGIRKEYKTGRQILTSDTFSDNRIG